MKSRDSTTHGILWQLAASVCNGIGLYFIHILVAKELGVTEYALFGILITLLMWVRVMIGSNNAISKYLLDSRYCQRDVLKKTIMLQFALCLLLCVASQIVAGPLSDYMNEPRLEIYFRILALDFIFSAGFTYLLRLQSTLRMFRVSAMTNFIFMTSRILLIILAIEMGWGLAGVCFAYLVSPLITTLFFIKTFKQMILPIWRNPQNGIHISYGELIRFSGFYVGFTVFYDMIIMLNLVITKSIIPDNVLIGYYVAVGVICKMPRVVLNHSVNAVMLTAVSEAVDQKKGRLVRHYFNQLMKLTLGLIVPYGIVVCVAGKWVLSVFYTESFALAAPLLAPYYAGFAGLTLIFIFSVFYVAENEPKIPFYFVLAMSVAQILLCYGKIPGRGLEGASFSLMITGVTGAVLFILLLIWELNRKTPVESETI